MTDTLTGDKAIIGQVLDKVELAARRVSGPGPTYTQEQYPMLRLAEEIMNIKRSLYDQTF